LEDYASIALGINEVNPTAADRFCDEVERSLQLLSTHPEIGSLARFTRTTGIRKWRLQYFRHYLIFYRFREERVELIRLLHGARDLPRVLRRED
jgi:toxin ParE1/3/4